jgi:DNA-binding PucR family transcriptional regulator
MLAEELVLDQLGAPLTVLDDVGVVLLRERARREPSSVRDELLRYFGPAPLWLVHGAGYDSFEGLRDALRQTITAARNARRDLDDRYVLEVHSRGLDSLLENAGLSDELLGFASNMLGPLTNHDEKTGSRLTETLCYTLALGSAAEAARRLFVHANTVRYRMRRAEQVLGHDLSSPKDRVAMTLAAFVWLRHNEQGGFRQ